MTRAHELLNAERATLFLLDEGSAQLYNKLAEVGVIRVPVWQGFAGTAAASGELLNVKESYSHPQVSHATSRHVILASQRAIAASHQ